MKLSAIIMRDNNWGVKSIIQKSSELIMGKGWKGFKLYLPVLNISSSYNEAVDRICLQILRGYKNKSFRSLKMYMYRFEKVSFGNVVFQTCKQADW